MGFSGGGSNILKPHTHDSNILQDGGNLDFDNSTQSDMAAKSMTYSDGSHLQELVGPGVPAGEILTFATAASAPSWATDPFLAGGKLEYLGSHTNVAEESTFTQNFSPEIDFTKFSAIQVYWSYDMDSTATPFDTQLILDANTAANYSAVGQTQTGTTITGLSSLSQANWVIASTAENTGNDNSIFGAFTITSHKGPASQQYPAISSYACGWSNTTRQFLGTKVTNLGTIASMTLTSSGGAGTGWENSTWAFYGVRI